MIRSVLGKFWVLYLVGVTIQLVVIAAVLVRFFASTNNIAKWLLNFIYDRGATLGGPAAFSFVIDWAEALSIMAVYIIFIPVFIGIMENRHQQALARVHIWATEAVVKLTRASEEESVADKLADWERRLHSIIDESDSALANTSALGNGLKPKVEKAIANLSNLEECFNNHAEPADLRNLLQTTIIALEDITNFTYNSLYHSP